MAKLCANCGGEVSDRSKFCPECGSPVAGQPQQISFEGVASRSVIQQIGSINVQGMREDQFVALTGQLAQLLERRGVSETVSAGATPSSLPPEACRVAEAVAQKVEEAQRDFGKPVGDPDMYLRLGNVACDGGNYAEALRYYDQALALDPSLAVAWNNRALTLSDLGRHQEAIASNDQALALDPNYAYAWNNRGVALNRMGRYQEAVASYDKALALAPSLAGAWNNRGVALGRLGRHRKAQESFTKAEQLRSKGR